MGATLVSLGKILKEWGIRGQVRVLSYNTRSDLYFQLQKLYVEWPEGWRPVPLESVRRQGAHWIFKFAGYENPESSRELRGLRIGLPREELPEPPPGEYYLADLIGLPVIDPNGETVGKIQNWMSVGETEVMVVSKNRGGELMIPFHEDFLEVEGLKDGKVILKKAAEDLL